MWVSILRINVGDDDIAGSPYRKFSAVYINNNVSNNPQLLIILWGYDSTNLRDGLAVQAHHNATERLISMLNVEVDLLPKISTACI
jgi:hypothetical protein